MRKTFIGCYPGIGEAHLLTHCPKNAQFEAYSVMSESTSTRMSIPIKLVKKPQNFIFSDSIVISDIGDGSHDSNLKAA